MNCCSTFILVAALTLNYGISTNAENDDSKSLVFVFDTTTSMSEELSQVQDGATKIFKTLSENGKKIIENYIFVEFNDPIIGPWINTTDTAEFQNAINHVMLHSTSYDCPEMSFGGIKKGLELCLPYSFVYVFTDATAKDKDLLPELLVLIQRKKTRVIFILTEGNCGDDEYTRPYPEYETIAQSSGGQIFDLSRNNDVAQVLEYIRLSLPSELGKVNLLSIDPQNDLKFQRIDSIYSIPVDEGLKEITTALSGNNISIIFTDPSGQQIDDSSKLVNLLNLEKIKVFSIQDPTAGVWKIDVGESKHYTLRVTGQSDFDFNYGFALGRINSMNDTNQRPLSGSRNNIFIAPNNDSYLSTLQSCEMIAFNGTVLQTVPLIKMKRFDNLYYGSFVPNQSNFYIRVIGETKKGTRLQRISVIAISSTNATEKPVIEGDINAASRYYSSSMVFLNVLVSFFYFRFCIAQ